MRCEGWRLGRVFASEVASRVFILGIVFGALTLGLVHKKCHSGYFESLGDKSFTLI